MFNIDPHPTTENSLLLNRIICPVGAIIRIREMDTMVDPWNKWAISSPYSSRNYLFIDIKRGSPWQFLRRENRKEWITSPMDIKEDLNLSNQSSSLFIHRNRTSSILCQLMSKTCINKILKILKPTIQITKSMWITSTLMATRLWLFTKLWEKIDRIMQAIRSWIDSTETKKKPTWKPCLKGVE